MEPNRATTGSLIRELARRFVNWRSLPEPTTTDVMFAQQQRNQNTWAAKRRHRKAWEQMMARTPEEIEQAAQQRREAEEAKAHAKQLAEINVYREAKGMTPLVALPGEAWWETIRRSDARRTDAAERT